MFQVTKLIEDSSNAKMSRTAISAEKIAAWLVDNEVLSIALEGLFHSNATIYISTITVLLMNTLSAISILCVLR